MSADLLRVYDIRECGPKGYPIAWERGDPRIPAVVREAAGHRCVRCGHPYLEKQSDPEWSECDERCTHGGPIRYMLQGDTRWRLSPGDILPLPGPKLTAVEAAYRVLTVHHLTGDKRDCRWWNLAALCQRCHLYIQGRVVMGQTYPFEHSEWFKPYAAGYYATTYLGEELSREEVDGRLDELLELELVT